MRKAIPLAVGAATLITAVLLAAAPAQAAPSPPGSDDVLSTGNLSTDCVSSVGGGEDSLALNINCNG